MTSFSAPWHQMEKRAFTCLRFLAAFREPLILIKYAGFCWASIYEFFLKDLGFVKMSRHCFWSNMSAEKFVDRYIRGKFLNWHLNKCALKVFKSFDSQISSFFSLGEQIWSEFFKSSSSTLSGLWLSPMCSCHSLFFMVAVWCTVLVLNNQKYWSH